MCYLYVELLRYYFYIFLESWNFVIDIFVKVEIEKLWSILIKLDLFFNVWLFCYKNFWVIVIDNEIVLCRVNFMLWFYIIVYIYLKYILKVYNYNIEMILYNII